MWYVSPQFADHGHSGMSRRYAIRSRAEAVAYPGRGTANVYKRSSRTIIAPLGKSSANPTIGSCSRR